MKRSLPFLLFIGCIVFSSLNLFAQVDNDNCQEASPIGPLSAGTETCITGNNFGANAELPYINQGYCQGDILIPGPSTDVWYSFEAVGNLLDINVTSEFDTLTLSWYEGDCDGLIGRDCSINLTGGSLTTTYGPVNPGSTYFLQISGGSAADQSEFDLCIRSYEVETEICIIEQNLTVTPPPTLGAYSPGQIVTVCIEIGGYIQNASDWFHGLVPSFGEGWDLESIDYIPPPNCDGSGEWGWYESVTGTAGSAIPSAQGPGFFYDSNAGGPLDGDPGNNYGDNSNGDLCDWTFCFFMQTVASCPPGVDGDDLSITFFNFSDSETGSWDAAASPCGNDPDFLFKALLRCCTAPDLVSAPPSCANPEGGSITAAGNGEPPYNFEWSNGFIEEGVTESTALGLDAGFYGVTVTDVAGCESAATLTLEEVVATGDQVTFPVSITSCGECFASEDNPLTVAIVNEEGVAGSFTITECPTDITICLPNEGSYNLNYDDQTIEGIFVDGEISSSEILTFIEADFSNPGTMPAAEQLLCAGESASASASGLSLFEDDVLIYALHTASGAAPGDIVAANATGTFSQDDGAINSNTMYYISSVVGPDADGDGVPDLDSNCTLVAPGTPVVFLNPVEFSLDEVCDWEFTGDYTVTATVLGGLPEYNNAFSYTVGGDYAGIVPFGGSFVTIFPEGETDQYSYEVIDDGNACTAITGKVFVCYKTPIELLQFDGEVLSEGNMLKWSTATETENDFFSLERSTDGLNFTVITTIDGAGNSSSPLNYQYLDKEAPSGLSYYRLSQTDFNGQEADLGIVSLTRGESSTTGLVINHIVPTPAKEVATVQFSYYQNSNIAVQLYNVTGQLVYNSTFEAQNGANNISLDLKNFSEGVYFLSLQNGSERVLSKLVKE